MGRDVVSTFNIPPLSAPRRYEEPLFDPGELPGCVPRSGQHTMNMYQVQTTPFSSEINLPVWGRPIFTLNAFQVIARIVDGSKFQEFKAMFGTTLVAGFACLEGYVRSRHSFAFSSK